MVITDNTFTNQDFGSGSASGIAIDINPATGFGHSGAGTAVGSTYLGLKFSDNKIRGGTLSSVGSADWDTWYGTVRFWHPDQDSWLQSGSSAVAAPLYLWQLLGGFHVHQDYLRYQWNITNNELNAVYFRITQARSGGQAVGDLINGEIYRQEGSAPPGTAVLNNMSLARWSGNTLLVSSATIGAGSTNPYLIDTNLWGLDLAGVSAGSVGSNPGEFIVSANAGIEGSGLGLPTANGPVYEIVLDTTGIITSANAVGQVRTRLWRAEGSTLTA